MLVRQSCAISGVTGIALTKLDVLDGFDTVKICTGYRLNGKILDYFPSHAADQAAVEPIYEEMDGWQETTAGARSWADLPAQAIKYISRVSGTDRDPGGAGIDQPRTRGHDPGARSVHGLKTRPPWADPGWDTTVFADDRAADAFNGRKDNFSTPAVVLERVLGNTPYMTRRDFAYSSPGAPGSQPAPISIFADDAIVRRSLCDDAELAGFHPVFDCPLGDLLHGPIARLEQSVMLHVDTLDALDCAAMLDLDDRMAGTGCRLIVSVRPGALDAVFACIDRSNPEILVSPTRGERLVALGLMKAHRPGNRVRELDDADREALQRLTDQVAQIAEQIDRLADGGSRAFRLGSPTDEFNHDAEGERQLIRPPRPPLPDPRLVRRIIRQRQLRAQFLSSDLFADPAWDILLDLTAARAEHARVSVTSLCIASGVPPTTALRWIGQMTDAGLLSRVEDESDRRRAFIELSDKAADAMARYFHELGKDAKALV